MTAFIGFVSKLIWERLAMGRDSADIKAFAERIAVIRSQQTIESAKLGFGIYASR
jgi:hypothetical protein